ncbi:MAG: hypothetical protein ACTHN5_06700 [Phycisphaerae bacterium]
MKNSTLIPPSRKRLTSIRLWRAVTAGALLSALSACQGGPSPADNAPTLVLSRDPAQLLSILASASNPDDSRQHADKLLIEQKGKTDPARLDVLEQLLYAPGHSEAMRIYALDQLADANPARAGHALDLYLPRFEGPVLDHACQLAAALGDARLTAPLTRSLARIARPAYQKQPPDEFHHRPEWSAIQKLAGKEPPDAFYDLIADATNPDVRIAALDILQALQPPETIAGAINKMDRHDPWLDDLRWYLALFNTPPVGANENAWMRYLHRPEFAPLIDRAAQRHRLLQKPSSVPYLFAPRFIAVLAYAGDADISADPQALREKIETRLAGLKHIKRPPQYAHARDDIDETLDANQAKLSRCDYLAIDLLLDALQNPATIAEFNRQGLDDLSDTSTEHGGLLSLQNINAPRLMITPYAPFYASNDFQYIASDKLLEETVKGIAQYHFHFQQIHNEERAGPGTGDLDYVRAQHCNAVVITSIDTRKINIDYYTPDGAVIDLGVYEAK